MANLPRVVAVEPTDEEVSVPPRAARLPTIT
jgi:hypothetical protein